MPQLLFIQLRFIDVLDILLVAILFYQLYKIVKGTVAINIFIGVLAIYLLWELVDAMKMKQLSKIIGQFINVGVIALVIVFQQEIRKFLIYLGTKSFSGRTVLFNRLLKTPETDKKEVRPVIQAAYNLAKTKTGALIVLANQSDLSFYESTGDKIDAALSARLLENIFFKNSPLHDGAAIIENNKIKAARCVLPVTEQDDLPAQYGMRHRAAIGITESSDCLAISVSEETGKVSLAKGGKIFSDLTREEMEKMMDEFYK
ncbi:MAG: diadenylate cyclase CdaA [Bacteroidetes bacterium]|nr:diadenylate cyclase CdaA [Bacteroidota bacterium]